LAASQSDILYVDGNAGVAGSLNANNVNLSGVMSVNNPTVCSTGTAVTVAQFLVPNMINAENTAAVLILGSTYTNTYNYGSLEFQMESSVGGGFNQYPNRMRLGVQTAYSEPETATGIYIDGSDHFYNARQTFDDGSGNMTISSNFRVNNTVNVTGVTAINTAGTQGTGPEGMPVFSYYGNYGAAFGTVAAGVGLSDNSVEQYCYQNYNVWQIDFNTTTPAFSVGGATSASGTSGLVRTRNNTLDDGNGNMAVLGNIALGGSTTSGITSSEAIGVYLDAAYMNLHFKDSASTSGATWQINVPSGITQG